MPFNKPLRLLMPENALYENVKELMRAVGEDPDRGGLQETPRRVVEAWKEWCDGYGKDPRKVMKAFVDGADGCDEMVIEKGIRFYSHCEHHMAPFFGKIITAYIPNGKIVGLSKMSRLTDIYAHRFQVQERLTNQIADAINDILKPRGVGVICIARHLCMESRGVRQPGCKTVTSALRGVIKTKPEARAEFLKLAR